MSVLSGIPFEQLAFGDEASKNEPLDGGVNLTHYDGDGHVLIGDYL